MKFTLSLLLVSYLFCLSSCKKDPVNTPLTNSQILTNQEWMVDEAFYSAVGIAIHYKRGGENSTGGYYETVRYSFNANGTGTYKDSDGILNPLTWNFANADEDTIKLTIVQGSPFSRVWTLEELSEKVISETDSSIPGILEKLRLVPAH